MTEKEQLQLKKALWINLFSEKNLELVREFRKLEFGRIIVIVHNGQAQQILQEYKSNLLKPGEVDPGEAGL